MRVKEGIPLDRNKNNETSPEIIEVVDKTSSAGEGAKKRSVGLSDEEDRADEDDEEDD